MTLFAVADFCLIPMGTGSTSVGAYIAECQRVLESLKQAGSIVTYEVHGYGTNLEGPFEAVSKAIELCHEAVHKMGAPRIATDIRIGTRVDKGPDSGQEEWEKGLGENERKRESVRRHLEAKNVPSS